MRPRKPANAGIVAGLLVASPTPSAFAKPACSGVMVEWDGDLRARWPELATRVHESFDARVQVDSCARVQLRATGKSIVIEVVLNDGRSTSRSVTREEDVVPTLEGLLLVPDVLAPTETKSVDAAPRGYVAVPRTKTPSVPGYDAPSPGSGGASTASTADRAGHLRVELGVSTNARIGDGQTSVGLGALSLVELSGWLVGFEGRVERYQMLGGPRDGAALELAVLGGHRIPLPTFALDLVAGPALAIRGMSEVATARATSLSSPESRQLPPPERHGAAPRLFLGGHLNFGTRATIGTYVGIDGELGIPDGAAGEATTDSPPLPTWSVGVAFGVTVGTH
jgi:hypothetical protein